MSATNRTTNYGLPIFIGSDVPSWLTDWNAAMNAIDTAIGNVLTVANTAEADVTVLEGALQEVKVALETATPVINETAVKVSELTGVVSSMGSTVEQLRTDFDVLEGDVGVIYSGLLSAGETTLTLSAPKLTDESMIDVYTSAFGVAPTLVETDVVAKTIRLTFAIQTDVLGVKVKVGE